MHLKTHIYIENRTIFPIEPNVYYDNVFSFVFSQSQYKLSENCSHLLNVLLLIELCVGVQSLILIAFDVSLLVENLQKTSLLGIPLWSDDFRIF